MHKQTEEVNEMYQELMSVNPEELKDYLKKNSSPERNEIIYRLSKNRFYSMKIAKNVFNSNSEESKKWILSGEHLIFPATPQNASVAGNLVFSETQNERIENLQLIIDSPVFSCLDEFSQFIEINNALIQSALLGNHLIMAKLFHVMQEKNMQHNINLMTLLEKSASVIDDKNEACEMVCKKIEEHFFPDTPQGNENRKKAQKNRQAKPVKDKASRPLDEIDFLTEDMEVRTNVWNQSCREKLKSAIEIACYYGNENILHKMMEFDTLLNEYSATYIKDDENADIKKQGLLKMVEDLENRKKLNQIVKTGSSEKEKRMPSKTLI